MGEVYWAEYQRDENGIWHGEETEAVLGINNDVDTKTDGTAQ